MGRGSVGCRLCRRSRLCDSSVMFAIYSMLILCTYHFLSNNVDSSADNALNLRSQRISHNNFSKPVCVELQKRKAVRTPRESPNPPIS